MKLKNLFALTLLFPLQTSCMERQHNPQKTQNYGLFADLPRDLLPIITRYSDCKTMAAWKQTCHTYNNDLHYYQIPNAIIERENYDMITDGLMYIAETNPALNAITYQFTDFNLNRSNELSLTMFKPAKGLPYYFAYNIWDEKQTEIHLKNFEKFLHNNSAQRIIDLKMLGWKDHPSLETDINAFIRAYKGLSGPDLTSFSYSELSSDILTRIMHINPNKEDKDYLTPLVWACTNKHVEIIKQLLMNKRTDLDKPYHYGQTVLYNACENNNIDIVKLLLTCPQTESGKQNNIAGKSETAFSIAYQKGHTKIVQLLLAHKPTKKHNDNDPIHLILGNTLLHQVCDNGHVKTVKLLLTFPEIDPNVLNNHKDTALHIACRKGHIEIVKLLLNHKNINLNKKGLCYKTPLEVAHNWKHTEIVQLLLSHPNTKNDAGYTILHQACLEDNIQIIKSLLDDTRTNLNIQDNEGNTALLLACKKDKTEIVKLLLTHPKIDLETQNTEGLTAFDIAKKNGYNTITKLLAFKKIRNNILYYAPRVVGITLLTLLLSYFFYTTTHNSVTI